MASRKIIAGAAAILFAASVFATTPADARNRGAAIAAGALLGIAAGAIIAGAASPPPPVYYAPGPAYGPVPADVEAYCFSRFKSYDPVSGTYLGYDGYRHPCP